MTTPSIVMGELKYSYYTIIIMEVIFTVLSVLNYHTHAIHSILFNVDLQKHVSLLHSMGKKQLYNIRKCYLQQGLVAT